MAGSHFDWQQGLWLVVLSGLLAIILAFFAYSPAFYITLFGGAEGHWAVEEHWARLSGNLVKFYMPIGFCAGICVALSRFMSKNSNGLSLLHIAFAGIISGLIYPIFPIIADVTPWVDIMKTDAIAGIAGYFNWAIVPIFLSVLICVVIGAARNFIGLRNL